jgi:Protein of unknown function (DUF1549)/Protein of unknown function (DUF1553)
MGLGLAAVACDRGAPPRVAAPEHTPAPPAASVVAATPHRMTSSDVDAVLLADWRAAGVAPTAPADDATWLRRLWIDVAGTIPPPEVVRRFLADPREPITRRGRAIDELLASPRWADHWTAYWDDVWMGRGARRPDVDAGAFRGWLHDAMARNEPWGAVVTELLTATGRNSAGGAKRDAEAYDGKGGAPEGVNGAVNWTLRYQDAPQDMAGVASRTLLGVQIQCAQCHDHKTEKWTQKDFQGFAAAFLRTKPAPVDDDPMARGKGTLRRVDLIDLGHAAPRFAKKMADVDAIVRTPPAAIDGTDLGGAGDVRVALARWVTSPGNPWFARAFVNRMWGHFLGRGFVDPVDDLRPSNPPVAPDVLEALAGDFAASGYDVKHLVRVIAGTAAYAASAAPLDAATARADPEAKLWERFRVTPLGPEELLDAVVAATRLDAIVERTGRLDMAQVRARVKQRYGFLFDVDEETDQSDYAGTIAQGLALLDGSVVATGASVLPGSALAEVLAMPGDDASRIEELYVRALSRLPAPAEIEQWTQFLRSARDTPGPGPVGAGRPLPPDPLRGLEARAGRARADARARAYEDLLWTLLNSSEFVLNH